jgi:hypothetical protein
MDAKIRWQLGEEALGQFFLRNRNKRTLGLLPAQDLVGLEQPQRAVVGLQQHVAGGRLHENSAIKLLPSAFVERDDLFARLFDFRFDSFGF